MIIIFVLFKQKGEVLKSESTDAYYRLSKCLRNNIKKKKKCSCISREFIYLFIYFVVKLDF